MDSVQIGDDYVGEVDRSGNAKIIKIVLTVAHLDHDIENNNYTNLRALCQRCHNRHDSANRKKNRDKHPKLF
jgi:5-methylcytosine-specific restriction endonuclease McrA